MTIMPLNCTPDVVIKVRGNGYRDEKAFFVTRSH